MRNLIALSLSFSFIFGVAQASTDASVQSFATWRAARVEEARAALEKLQGERPATTKVLDRKPLENKASRGDQKVQQAQLNLEVARDLTINDYFVLYLSQLKSREQFVEAAKKLNPEESADLMMSYQKHLTSGASNYDQVVPPSTGVGATAPTRTN